MLETENPNYLTVYRQRRPPPYCEFAKVGDDGVPVKVEKMFPRISKLDQFKDLKIDTKDVDISRLINYKNFGKTLVDGRTKEQREQMLLDEEQETVGVGGQGQGVYSEAHIGMDTFSQFKLGYYKPMYESEASTYGDRGHAPNSLFAGRPRNQLIRKNSSSGGFPLKGGRYIAHFPPPQEQRAATAAAERSASRTPTTQSQRPFSQPTEDYSGSSDRDLFSRAFARKKATKSPTRRPSNLRESKISWK